jgi:hypothetical protein
MATNIYLHLSTTITTYNNQKAINSQTRWKSCENHVKHNNIHENDKEEEVYLYVWRTRLRMYYRIWKIMMKNKRKNAWQDFPVRDTKILSRNEC